MTDRNDDDSIAPSSDSDAVVAAAPEASALSLDFLFHRLANVVPDEQAVVAVTPETPAREALALMAERGFSQLPIVRNDVVLGLFSFRSFALRAVSHPGRPPLEDMPVDEFSESVDLAEPTDDLESVFDSLDRDGAALLGARERLVGVVTPMDMLRFLRDLAEPYVQLGEIERSLRMVAARSVAPDQLRECSRRALTEIYAGREEHLPVTTDDMTLGDLVSTIRHSDNYALFAPILGVQRQLVTPRLSPLPELRNIVFHFRRPLTETERSTLAETRAWLLLKLWGREA